MTQIYLSGKEPLIKSIVRKSFPDYRGKKISLQTEETVNVRSYWDGGSRDYYHFLHINENGELISLGDVRSMSAFEHVDDGSDRVPMSIVANFIVVRHSIFCGKDMGISIIVHPTMMNAGFLPSGNECELTEDEKKVLYYTRCYKNTYGGRTDIRRTESGLPVDQWKSAQSSLITKKMLNKSFSLTVHGRNVAANLRY